MEGDEKRTPGQRLDEAIEDQNFYKVVIQITYRKPKSESPRPGKPSKETR